MSPKLNKPLAPAYCRLSGAECHHRLLDNLGESDIPWYFEDLKDTRNPGLETRRRFCNPFHHYSCAHIRFSLCEELESNVHANQIGP